MPTVMLPKALAGYRCQRSLVCCRPPWRVWLAPEEVERLGSEHVEPLGGGRHLLAQRDNACSLLHAGPPGACTLHRDAGHDALPRQCQNFPRSVARRADGQLELAFLLDCPTVAGMVAQLSEPFALVEGETFALPVAPVNPSIDLAALDAARERWWSRLADAQTSRDLLAVASAMGAGDVDPVPELTLGMLYRLADGARFWPHHTALLEALKGGRRDAEVDGLAVGAFAYAAAMGVQQAALHDGRPLEAGIRAAGTALVTMLNLHAAIVEVCDEDATMEVMVAATHSGRMGRMGEGVLTG